MREILFRGIPKEKFDGYAFTKVWGDNCEGSFVYGSLIISKDRYYICVSALCRINCCIGNGTTSMIEVIPESVSEFTGLTDKNGKKIFEGDIVAIVGEAKEMITEEQQIFVVKWQDEDCGFSLLCFFEYEVIGNIHDNPELLKSGEG